MSTVLTPDKLPPPWLATSLGTKVSATACVVPNCTELDGASYQCFIGLK